MEDRTLIIAIDIDGVLANFTSAYEKRIVKVTGENKFPKNFEIPCWDWDKFYGYTNDQISLVWEDIAQDGLFWQKLAPLASPEVFTRLNVLSKEHPVYFITNRMGLRCKQQTEKWLYEQGINYPTVLITGEKRPVLVAIRAEFFIDDRLETMNELTYLKRPHFYLADTSYNRANRNNDLHVASNIQDALTKAGLW